MCVQADYRVVMSEYEKEHPKPPRRQKRARDPTELKRPQSAYFFFLADFRQVYKVVTETNPTAHSWSCMKPQSTPMQVGQAAALILSLLLLSS